MPPGHAHHRIERTVERLIRAIIVEAILLLLASIHMPGFSQLMGFLASIVGVYIGFLLFILIMRIIFAPTVGREARELADRFSMRIDEWADQLAKTLRGVSETAVEAARTAMEAGRPPGRALRGRRPHWFPPWIPQKSRYGEERRYVKTRAPPRGEEETVPVTRRSQPGFPSQLAGRYRPLEYLGEGGFSRVWKVERLGDGRVYALKIPKTELGPRALKVLAKEAVHWEDLGVHPNIVRLYEWDVEPVPWILMEYVEGIPLGGSGRARSVRDLLEGRGPMDSCMVALMLYDAASALEHAHSKGIVHLDVKPSNILLARGGDGRILYKLSDWGLSKVAVQGTGTISGVSPAYMTPEHSPYSPYSSRGLGAWTDIYMLGLTAYEAWTGLNYNDLLASHENPLARLQDSPLKTVLKAMLDPDPDRRPTAAQVRAMAEKIVESLGCRSRWTG
ncbi:MAG: serine/threonine protein kinase [Desulfurococcales archaeon]|nr:serine/threonine protein kinase [Desulfurococcales archaeon]